MHNIVVGMIVKSIAGHDKDKFYIVIKVTDEGVLISDGKLRTIEKPKQKNRKHLLRTNKCVNVDLLVTNQKIRRVLWPYNYGLAKLDPK